MKTYILSAIFPGTVGIVLGATLFNNIELTNINIVEAIPLDKSKLNFNQNISIVTPILTQ